jgi:hypothetical protein
MLDGNLEYELSIAVPRYFECGDAASIDSNSNVRAALKTEDYASSTKCNLISKFSQGNPATIPSSPNLFLNGSFLF